MKFRHIAEALLSFLSILSFACAASDPKVWGVSACDNDVSGHSFNCSARSPSGVQWCNDINTSFEFFLTNIQLGDGWVICDYTRPTGGRPYGARQWGGIHVGTQYQPRCPRNQEYNEQHRRCVAKRKPKKCQVGNPIDIDAGAKVQEDTDASILLGTDRISITRFYSSVTALKGTHVSAPQLSWTFSFMDKLEFSPIKISIGGPAFYEYLLEWRRPNSEVLSFTGQTVDSMVPADPSIQSIRPQIPGSSTSGWVIIDRNGDEYTFNNKGALTGYSAYGKLPITFVYQNSNYEIVAKQGTTELFRYVRDVQGKIQSLIVPGIGTYLYAYDSRKNLVRVTYPDSTTRIYHYESTSFPRALTGITDRTGIRYVTWVYDASGRAISSEGANGRHRYTLDFSFESDLQNPRIITTNPLGKQTSYHILEIGGARKFRMIEGHASDNCAAASQYRTFYSTGDIETETDWEGNVTYFEYDSSGRQVLSEKGLRWMGGNPKSGIIQNTRSSLVASDAGVVTTRSCRYPSNGLVFKMITNDAVIFFDYDQFGRLTGKETHPRSAQNDQCT